MSLSRLRFAACSAFLLLTSVSHQALAAVDQAAIQSQLQAEWDDFITRMNGAATSNGKLTITPASGGYKATLPLLTVKLQDNNSVMLENTAITASPSTNGTIQLKIVLPATIPQFYQTQKTGQLTIGKQDLNIAVKPAGDTWQVQTVDGTLNNLNWQQDSKMTTNPIAPVQATIGTLALNGKPSQLSLQADTISTRNIRGDNQTIGQLSLSQQTVAAQSLRLSDVLVLLTGSIPQLETGHGGMAAWIQGAAKMNAHIKNMKTTKADGTQLSSVDDIALQSGTTDIANGKMSVRLNGTIKNIAMNVPAAFADIIPQNADFSGTLRNLPTNYLSMPFNTPAAQKASHAALTTAGTQLQIDTLNTTAKGGLKANGTGLLTATNAPPTYTTGNITLNLSNLQDTMTKMQQQSAHTANPLMMVLMVLQGMGRANGNQTQYNINFAPDGRILVNDQDISALTKMMGVKSSKEPTNARPIPVAPVTTEETAPVGSAPASGMSTWKK